MKSEVLGPWVLFEAVGEVPLVETLRQQPIVYDGRDWKSVFYRVFKDYKAESRDVIAGAETSDTILALLSAEDVSSLLDPEDVCKPSLEVDFNHIHLKTDCPGKVHLLKFGYHPAWKASKRRRTLFSQPGLFCR